MIFREILESKTELLNNEFKALLAHALLKQSHNGDLLLLSVNDFYYPEVHTWDNVEAKQSPYVIGPGDEGHSGLLHHNFIGTYLSDNMCEQVYKDYVAAQQWTPERASDADQLHNKEAHSIQFEMLIYQKIWEMDSYIKKIYQLARIVNAEAYDWHFRIKQSVHVQDKGYKREKVIRELVRDRLKADYQSIYAALKNAYKTQVRNSIAHSKYSIFGRYIHLNNFIANDPNSQLQVVSFDEWVDMIHDTIILYNEVSKLNTLIDSFYLNLAKNNNGAIEVRINRIDPVEKVECHMLKPRMESGGGWYWAANDLQ